ncbi:hypothetical protein ACJX0J_006401, partial [Zea mays]
GEKMMNEFYKIFNAENQDAGALTLSSVAVRMDMEVVFLVLALFPKRVTFLQKHLFAILFGLMLMFNLIMFIGLMMHFL